MRNYGEVENVSPKKVKRGKACKGKKHTQIDRMRNSKGRKQTKKNNSRTQLRVDKGPTEEQRGDTKITRYRNLHTRLTPLAYRVSSIPPGQVVRSSLLFWLLYL